MKSLFNLFQVLAQFFKSANFVVDNVFHVLCLRPKVVKENVLGVMAAAHHRRHQPEELQESDESVLVAYEFFQKAKVRHRAVKWVSDHCELVKRFPYVIWQPGLQLDGSQMLETWNAPCAAVKIDFAKVNLEELVDAGACGFWDVNEYDFPPSLQWHGCA